MQINVVTVWITLSVKSAITFQFWCILPLRVQLLFSTHKQYKFRMDCERMCSRFNLKVDLANQMGQIIFVSDNVTYGLFSGIY
jgi:hypothetical protein